MTTLVKALSDVAAQLGLDAGQLIGYAAEDTLPGYYDGGGRYAIPYTADGQFLYALIRALKPGRVLEIGTAQGGSARHILEALQKNRQGDLFAIDINSDATLEGVRDDILLGSDTPHGLKTSGFYNTHGAVAHVKLYGCVPPGFD